MILDRFLMAELVQKKAPHEGAFLILLVSTSLLFEH